MPDVAPLSTPVRVAFVEDHAIVREGLAHLLGEVSDIDVVRSVGTVPELVGEPLDVDLVILDLRLEDGSTPENNVAAIREWGAESLVLTAVTEPRMVRSAARAGVLGVLRKSAPTGELVEAIRQAASGKPVATSDWASALDGDDELTDARLSAREQEVLTLYASGLKAQEVAYRTGLSRDTIAHYVSRIRAKYASAGRPAYTKVDLLKRALEDGLLGS
jgi:DNA-binding NarL/FixJ family response regulator